MRTVTAGLIGLLIAVSVIAAEEQERRPKSPAAVSAIRAYEKSIKDAEETARRTKLLAVTKLKAQLEKVKVDVMKAGQLDEANAIQAMIDSSSSQAINSLSGLAQQFTIETDKDWQFVTDVKEGETLHIQAAGNWQNGRGIKPFGPDGPMQNGKRQFYLEGRVAEGSPIDIGSGITLQIPSSGRLEMRMNDGKRSDNSGSVIVTISRNLTAVP